MPEPLFQKIALVGIGLIGSSLAHVVRRERLAGHIAISTRSAATLKRAEELGLGDSYSTDAGGRGAVMPIWSSSRCRSVRRARSRRKSRRR